MVKAAYIKGSFMSGLPHFGELLKGVGMIRITNLNTRLWGHLAQRVLSRICRLFRGYSDSYVVRTIGYQTYTHFHNTVSNLQRSNPTFSRIIHTTGSNRLLYSDRFGYKCGDGVPIVGFGVSNFTWNRQVDILSKGDSQNISIRKGYLHSKRFTHSLTNNSGGGLSVTSLSKQIQSNKSKNNTYSKIINHISNPEVLKLAYLLIKSNKGNMTVGTNKVTLDSISLKWIDKVASELRKGTYKFDASRIKLIPKKKKSGGYRPLDIGSPLGRDKVIEKAILLCLEPIWEKLFLDESHGFRPGRSTHTALKQLYLRGAPYTWVIQGDINKCFENHSIPHSVIIKFLKSKIKCDRTLSLIKGILSKDMINPEMHGSGSLLKPLRMFHLSQKLKLRDKGTRSTQGSILSPLFCNIVLHQLDLYMEKRKQAFESGANRRISSQYNSLNIRRSRSNDPIERRDLLSEMRKIRKIDSFDPYFKRLLYVRYADDFIVLIIGNKDEAILIRNLIKDFLLQKCGLELNMDKSNISNISKEGFSFLGSDICKAGKLSDLPVRKGKTFSRRIAPRLLIKAPIKSIIHKLLDGKFVKYNAKSELVGIGRTDLINLTHEDILKFYNAQIRGLLNYYSFASNYSSLKGIHWLFRQSCGMTLARKFKLGTKRAAMLKFGADLKSPDSDLKLYRPKSFKVKHEFKTRAGDPFLNIPSNITWGTKLTNSVLDQPCAICGGEDNVEMHHIRSVKDVRYKINKGKASFAHIQGAQFRKQVPLCRIHHDMLHGGNLNREEVNMILNWPRTE